MAAPPLSNIEELLAATGEHLAAEDARVGIVVLGCAALNLLGVVSRATRDVDVVALGQEDDSSDNLVIGPPEPLPEPLELLDAVLDTVRDDVR